MARGTCRIAHMFSIGSLKKLTWNRKLGERGNIYSVYEKRRRKRNILSARRTFVARYKFDSGNYKIYEIYELIIISFF